MVGKGSDGNYHSVRVVVWIEEQRTFFYNSIKTLPVIGRQCFGLIESYESGNILRKGARCETSAAVSHGFGNVALHGGR
jgi:hypothetical protein